MSVQADLTSHRQPPQRIWHAGVVAFLAAWWLVYRWLVPFSEWITGLVPVDRHSHTGEAIAFFFYDVPKVMMLLALIAAVVAEFAAGSAGAGSGLAFRLLESQYRLNIPRMFAGLFLIAGTGVSIYAVLSLISHLLLHKWHESAIKRES